MTPQLVLDVAREAIWVMIKIGAPTMRVALVVGLAVSLLQALTQVQEATLAFVPKVLAIAVTSALLSEPSPLVSALPIWPGAAKATAAAIAAVATAPPPMRIFFFFSLYLRVCP